MTFVALAFSALIVALGVLGLVSPSVSVRVVRRFQTLAGLYFAAALRLVMGVAMFFAAPDSRAPEVLRTLGAIIVVAGLITPFVGTERYAKLVDWWASKGPVLVRGQGAFAIILGVLLAYVLLR